MKRLIDLSNEDARTHFLKGSSYFHVDLPHYISFEPILNDVMALIGRGDCFSYKSSDPELLPHVNYSFISNKDGRFAWRPLELMHPAIYVSLVNLICEETNWEAIRTRFREFEGGIVDCCSAPVMSIDDQKDVAAQVRSWWQSVEQRSLVYSLQFSHLLHTDVTDCYGSLYTHSITWALHGIDTGKLMRGDNQLLGNKIDRYIRAGRYGQTNGIAQGSVLMDFVAEIVLGYVDQEINKVLEDSKKVRILRYRDDYRIFANSDECAEDALKVVSDKLRIVGMKLGVSKTVSSRNVVEGSIKPDKLAGIGLRDLGDAHARTIQKQLLRLHSFGQRHPNSGALKRLVSEFHERVLKRIVDKADLEVLIAIATDIGFVSPSTFPAVAAILSHLISLAPDQKKKVALWTKVREKMSLVPYNGYLEIWLQRVTRPRSIGLVFKSNEKICRLVNKESLKLWESSWISSPDLRKALDATKIVVGDVADASEVIKPQEIALFTELAWAY